MATDPYLIVDDDAEDEIFYSTCYEKRVVLSFGGPPPPPAPFKVGDRCLSCADTLTAATTSYWQLADSCTMCTRTAFAPGATLPSPPPGAVAAPPGTQVASSPPPPPPPSPPPPSQSVVTAAFSASGDVSDFDPGVRQSLRAVIGASAGVPTTAVSLDVSAGSVIITATILVLTEMASETATALATSIFASPLALQSALADDGVGGIDVLNITHAPATTVVDGEGQLGDGDAALPLTPIVAGAGGAAVLCLLLACWVCRRRQEEEPPPPPPPVPTGGGDAARKSVVRKRYSAFDKDNEMHSLQPMPPAVPPPAVPPSALPTGWSEQYDPSSGRTYYHNEHTGEVTWTLPQ